MTWKEIKQMKSYYYRSRPHQDAAVGKRGKTRRLWRRYYQATGCSWRMFAEASDRGIGIRTNAIKLFAGEN